MMDFTEVIQSLKMTRDIFISEHCVANGEADEVMEEFKIAIDAIEKQIPKKPIENGKYCACPCCKYEFPDIGGVCEIYGESEEYDYCPNCGQAIDYNKEGDSE